MEQRKLAGRPELPEFPIDQELLESATQSREKWLSLRDRIRKIEESRKNVSAQVYERVHGDYAARLAEAQAELMEKRESIQHELAQLQISHDTIAAQLGERKLALEEIEFRHRLSEFDEDEYQAKVEGEREKISKFEAVMSAVKANIATYEAIFEGTDELAQKPAAAAAPKKKSSHEEETGPSAVSGGVLGRYVVESREPKTDEHGYIIEEERPDYFQETDEAIDISHTAKAAPPSEDEQAEEVERASRLVVINGKNKGTIHALKDTFTVGRAETNSFPLADPKVSRRHSQIKRKGKDYVIIDLKSSNGTFVNGERVDEHVLSDGDEIQIGDAVLQFHA